MESEPPPSAPPENTTFFQELKRRKVFQVAGTYLLVGWLVIQITVAVFPQFDIPTWASRFVILLVALGFPIALILAWAFELTPDGVRPTRQVREEQAPEAVPGAHQRRRNRFALLFGALFPAFLFGLIFGGAGLWVATQRSGPPPAPAPGTAAIPATTPVPAANPVLAVLPFVNMSPEAENAFFADGVHEDLLTNLSRISQLRVISRTSVMGYAGTALNLRQIAEELRASHILEGSVRRAGNRVRVTAQLIDAVSDEHLWAGRFDRDLDDIFAIQAQVADEIAAALRTELTPSEREALHGAPTTSVEAYDLYLRAREKMRARVRMQEQFEAAAALLREAVDLDPRFSDAWSRLAWIHASKVHFEYGDPEENLATADRALARAKALAPERPETLLAESYVRYHGRRDNEGALEVLRRVIEASPGQAELIEAEGYVLRRMGRFNEGLDRLYDALRLDPRNGSLLGQMQIQLRQMGRFAEALDLTRRLTALYPDDENLRQQLFGLEMTLRPDRERIQAWADEHESLLEAGEDWNFETIATIATIRLLDNNPEAVERLRTFISRLPDDIQPNVHTTLTFSLLQHARYFRDTDRSRRLAARLIEEAAAIRTEFDNPQFQIWRHTTRLLIALEQDRREEAERHFEQIKAIYHSAPDPMRQADLRPQLATARILLYPESAYEIYLEEKQREMPGLFIQTILSFPFAYRSLIEHPEIRREARHLPGYAEIHRRLLADLES